MQFKNFRGAPLRSVTLAKHEHRRCMMQLSATLRGQNIRNANVQILYMNKYMYFTLLGACIFNN